MKAWSVRWITQTPTSTTAKPQYVAWPNMIGLAPTSVVGTHETYTYLIVDQYIIYCPVLPHFTEPHKSFCGWDVDVLFVTCSISCKQNFLPRLLGLEKNNVVHLPVARKW